MSEKFHPVTMILLEDIRQNPGATVREIAARTGINVADVISMVRPLIPDVVVRVRPPAADHAAYRHSIKPADQAEE